MFVFPSETETFGNVVIEAAASGVPSIVAAAGAAHELVIDGVTGDVIDSRDPPALARAIVRQLDDAARRARMGTAARAHASQLRARDRGQDRVLARLRRGRRAAERSRAGARVVIVVVIETFNLAEDPPADAAATSSRAARSTCSRRSSRRTPPRSSSRTHRTCRSKPG